MNREREMKMGEDYTFICKDCCGSKDDTPCVFESTGEYMPEFCPFEGKKCKWEMVMEDEE